MRSGLGPAGPEAPGPGGRPAGRPAGFPDYNGVSIARCVHVLCRSAACRIARTKRMQDRRHQRNELQQLHTSSMTFTLLLPTGRTPSVSTRRYSYTQTRTDGGGQLKTNGRGQLRVGSGIVPGTFRGPPKGGYRGASSVVEQPRRGPGSVYRPRTRDCFEGAVGPQDPQRPSPLPCKRTRTKLPS